MTHIRIRCRNCGATDHQAVYGYTPNPLGIPFSRCPYCGAIARSDASAEWIQMTPWTKYTSIHPRAGASAFFLGIVLLVLFTLASGALLMYLPGFTLPPVAVLPLLVVPFALSHWLLVCRRANSEEFLEQYCRSLLRTRNEEYLALLKKHTEIYDEAFPKWVRLSDKAKAYIASYLESHEVMEEPELPSLFDVRNSI